MAAVVSAVAAAFAVDATIAVIATAISEVGIALSVVGAITGSKELTQIGGVLGLAGGVGGLAAAGLDAVGTATATSLAGSAVDETVAETARLAAGEATASAADNAITSAVGDSTSGIINNGMQGYGAAGDAVGAAGAPPSFTPDVTVPGAAPATSAADQASVNVGAPTEHSAGDVSTPDGSTGSSSPMADGTNPDARFPNGTDGVSGRTPPDGTTFDAIKRWWDKQPASTQQAYLKVGQSAIGGLFDGWSAEQKLALEKSKFALTQTQYNNYITNGSAVPKLNFNAPPAAPAPALAPSGIINQARVI